MAWRVGIRRHFIFFSLKKIQFINNLVSFFVFVKENEIMDAKTGDLLSEKVWFLNDFDYQL